MSQSKDESLGEAIDLCILVSNNISTRARQVYLPHRRSDQHKVSPLTRSQVIACQEHLLWQQCICGHQLVRKFGICARSHPNSLPSERSVDQHSRKGGSSSTDSRASKISIYNLSLQTENLPSIRHSRCLFCDPRACASPLQVLS